MTSPIIDIISGFTTAQAIKAPCKCATTANITLEGEKTIDGVNVFNGDRVLVKNQSDARENGIYIVGNAWLRAKDFDSAVDVMLGTIVLVNFGTANENTLWKMSSEIGSFDVSPITFSELELGGGGGAGSVNPASLIGVNTTASLPNRLSVSSSSVLFSHDGEDIRVNINKQAESRNASIIFQNNFSGRAELGLTGNDNFTVRVSPNGSTFTNAIVINKDTASVSLPNTTFVAGQNGFGNLAFFNTVDSSRIQNSSINASKIANNAVTLAKLDTGTANRLLGYNGSGAAAQITVGSGLSLSAGNLTATGVVAVLDGLSDVVISSPLTNQVLQYNGTNWVNSTFSIPNNMANTLSGYSASGVFSVVNIGTGLSLSAGTLSASGSGSGAEVLNDLTDVVISSPVNGQILQYNGTSWVNVDALSGTFTNPFISRLEVSINSYDTNPATIPYDITNGGLGLSSGGVYTTGSGGVIYQTLSIAEADGTSHDVAGFGAKGIASANNSDVWAATLVGVIADGLTGCSAHGLEIGIINQGNSSNNTYGLVIVGDGNLSSATTNDAAIQIQVQRASPSGTGQFVKGIVFNPSPQQMVTTGGTLIECASGTYLNGIDLGTSDFTGGHILKSAKYNLENSGAIDFKGQSDTDWLTVKINGTSRKTPLYDTSETIKPGIGGGVTSYDELSDITTTAITGGNAYRFIFSGTDRVQYESAAGQFSFANMYATKNANYTGGTVGTVGSVIRADAVVSAGVANFEWALFGSIQTAATGGENVGVYGQAWATASNHGSVWAMCTEARERVDAQSSGALHGIEVGVFGASGANTNRNRIGVMVVAGKGDDGLTSDGFSASETWAGLYVTSFNLGTSGYYKNGIHVGNDPLGNPTPMTCENGIRIATNGTTGIWDTGAKTVGCYMAGVYTGAAFRMNQGQVISYTATDSVVAGFNGSYISQNRGLEIYGNAGSTPAINITSGGGGSVSLVRAAAACSWAFDAQDASVVSGLLRGQSFEIQAGGRLNFKDGSVFNDSTTFTWGGQAFANGGSGRVLLITIQGTTYKIPLSL